MDEKTNSPWGKPWFKNFLFFLFICIAFFTGFPQWAHLKVRQLLLRQPEMHLAAPQEGSLFTLDWTLLNASGVPVSIRDFQGKPMLISFWADWCMPCLAEMPSLEKLHGELGEDVNFLMVTGEPIDKTLLFLEKKPIGMPVYFYRKGWPELLAHEGIPATFIIDGEGRVVYERLGAADWDGPETVSGIKGLLGLQ